VLTCFAGCSWQDIAAALRSRNLTEEAAPPRREPPPPKTTTADAAALWREALPVEGTLAARYVAARGLPPPPPSLRFLPDGGPT
jgi:putative DNA primase/helicase